MSAGVATPEPPSDSSPGTNSDSDQEQEQEHSIVSGFRFLARREFTAGRGERLYLTHCPICLGDLDGKSFARHLEGHSWDDVEAMRERARLRATGGGQATLPTSDPDAPW